MIKKEVKFPKLRSGNNGDVVLGCDPEFFFRKNGKLIGSHEVIPESGIAYNGTRLNYDTGKQEPVDGSIVRDGVQAELNPRPDTCRQRLACDIGRSFMYLYQELQKPENKGVTIDMSQTVALTQEEMDTLPPESKQFGCTPSFNVYGDQPVGVRDASKYMSRSAGGHIHLGAVKDSAMYKTLKDFIRLIPVIDLVVGNTCVLIDRSEGNKIRRQTYGRAGEYRLPKHGIEYRTLSNFWLKNYTLMSLVTGLIRQAVYIVHNSTKEHDYAKQLMSLVNVKDVVDAINNNDRELAQKNFDKIKGFMAEVFTSKKYAKLLPNNRYYDNAGNINFVPEGTEGAILYDNFEDIFSTSSLPQLEHFLSKPIDYWFKEDTMANWNRIGGNYEIEDDTASGFTGGIESFLRQVVQTDMDIKS